MVGSSLGQADEAKGQDLRMDQPADGSIVPFTEPALRWPTPGWYSSVTFLWREILLDGSLDSPLERICTDLVKNVAGWLKVCDEMIAIGVPD